MKATGIWRLAIGAGIAVTLAGCAAGPGGKSGDPAAATLVAEEISTQSLDAGPLIDPVADPGTAPVASAAGTAATDLAAEADPAAGQTVTAAAEPAPKARKGLFGFLKGKPKPAGAETAATAQTAVAVAPPRSSVRMVDRDVEAPDVFSVTEPGLWDGRPSLGGVWVAYADVRDPERVIIRNADTGAFVIGALFRRERENPGPRLQVSSDAAAALGMLAGAPAKLNVTALRREEVVDPADAEALLGSDSPIRAKPLTPADVAPSQTGVAQEAVAATARPAKPAATASGQTASDASADGLSAAAPQAPAPQAAARAADPVAKAGGGKSFLQVGIFSVEVNANNTATSMTTNGLPAQVVGETSKGKTFWRVIVGPAATASERDAILAKVKKLGFADAYFVSG